MKLLDMIKKMVVPTVLGVMTVDSYRRQIFNDLKLNARISALEKELVNKGTEDIAEKIVPGEFETKVSASLGRLKEYKENILENIDKLKECSQTNDPDGKWRGFYRDAMEREAKKFSNEVESLRKAFNSDESEIVKSDLSGYISDLINKYQTFLDGLTLDQIVAVFNIVMLSSILMTLFSMSILLVGDYLIDKLKLEIRWPRLSRIIRLKQLLNKHYLMFYISIIYILVILGVIGNLYMFSLKYFV